MIKMVCNRCGAEVNNSVKDPMVIFKRLVHYYKVDMDDIDLCKSCRKDFGVVVDDFLSSEGEN